MQTANCRCLVLGPQGAGKSLLLKTLRYFCREKRDKDSGKTSEAAGTSAVELIPTLPTVGSAVEEMKLRKNLTCVLKEYGGCMAPVWSAAYSDCDLVVYVIDASNPAQIAAATILLVEALGHPALKNTPFLVVFNKLDCQSAMSLTEYKSVMRLDDIVEHAPQSVRVVEGSCAKGTSLLCQITEWIVEQKK